MSIPKTKLFIFIGVIVLLNGCVALNLREANHELANLYVAKSEAINNKQWEQEVTVNAALAALAEEAAAQGADKSLSTLNRISFYRIASTAAWQAGEADVVAYATEGFSLCSQENYAKVPRDCGMLSVIPDFASVDDLTKRLDDAQQRLASSGPNSPTEEEIVQLSNDIRDRIHSLLTKREPIQKSSAHPRLREGIDERTGTILCSHLHTADGLIIQVVGVESAAHRNAQCDDYKLQMKMKNLGFSQQIAPCLPPGDPQKPRSCQ